MPWVYHDSFTSSEKAKAYGASIVELGLAKGIKVVKEIKTLKRRYSLYISPIGQDNVKI